MGRQVAMKDKNVQRVVYEPHKRDRCNGCPLARIIPGERAYCDYTYWDLIPKGKGTAGVIYVPPKPCIVRRITITVDISKWSDE